MRSFQSIGIGALAGLLLAVGVSFGATRVGVSGQAPQEVPVVKIEATARGFVPDTVRVATGAPVDLEFTRTTGSACVAQVHIPRLGIERTPLPKDQPVRIRIAPQESGTFEFLCGMDMHRGTIIAETR